MAGAVPTRGPTLLAIMGRISTMVSEVRPELNRGPVVRGVLESPVFSGKAQREKQKTKKLVSWKS